MNCLMAQLLALGTTCVEDMEYVNEDDICTVLKLTQVRKLFKAWTPSMFLCLFNCTIAVPYYDLYKHVNVEYNCGMIFTQMLAF